MALLVNICPFNTLRRYSNTFLPLRLKLKNQRILFILMQVMTLRKIQTWFTWLFSKSIVLIMYNLSLNLDHTIVISSIRLEINRWLLYLPKTRNPWLIRHHTLLCQLLLSTIIEYLSQPTLRFFSRTILYAWNRLLYRIGYFGRILYLLILSKYISPSSTLSLIHTTFIKYRFALLNWPFRRHFLFMLVYVLNWFRILNSVQIGLLQFIYRHLFVTRIFML